MSIGSRDPLSSLDPVQKKRLDELNTDQRAAVTHGNGPLCIVAGPGSGKTKTLATKIWYLLQVQHVLPEEILALTFTNKAAHEMRERVQAALSPRAKLPLICTFHALAARLLPEPHTSLLDETTRLAILRNLKKEKAVRGQTVRDIGLAISRAKNTVEPIEDPGLRALVEAYNLELAARHVHDFDDLLLNLYRTLQERALSEKPAYRFILVDEFQDTNDLQYRILQLLDTTGNIFVIGDPMQSIYGFRGADASMFERFEADWPGTRCITLGTNYRSAPEIVHVSNAIFPDRRAQRPYRQKKGCVQTLEVLNEYAEADWIVNQIEQQIGGSDMLRSADHHHTDAGQTFQSFAVLYRTHAVAKTLTQTLEKSGIPYQVAGEGSPYFDTAVQAVIQALEYLAARVGQPEAKGFTSTQLQTLLAPLKSSVQVTRPLTMQVADIVETLKLSFEKHRALRSFTNSLVPYDDMSLAEYLDHLQSLSEQAYYDPAAEAITLLTIHAAKGLEFSRVFVIGAEEGILPHLRKGKPISAAHLEEEKRLFYVAVTRARDELYLLHARTRQRQPQVVSSFITALPTTLTHRTTDSALIAQQQKAHKRALKRAQGSLF